MSKTHGGSSETYALKRVVRENRVQERAILAVGKIFYAQEYPLHTGNKRNRTLLNMCKVKAAFAIDAKKDLAVQ